VFDKATADRACRFFDTYLRHVKGRWAGKPMDLAPWQRDRIIRPLFGELRANGTRQYRQSLICIPRKNGKSTLSAGIALYLLFGDREPGAEIYSAAADRDQAAIVFDAARAMVESSPALSKRCKVYRRAICVPATNSVYRVLSADAPTKHGLNAHGVIFDELHAQPKRDLWDVLTTSTGARSQPLVVAITTAGYDKHSICYEVYDYAKKVEQGVIDDPAFLPVLYEADAGADFSDPEQWAKANPNLNVSVNTDYFEAEAAKARELPSYENTFRQLHLNQWTEQATRWLPMERWNAVTDPVEPKALEGRACYAGLDLSTTTDLSALVLLFPDDKGGYDVLPFFWVPMEGARRRERRDRVPYLTWIAQNHIEATPGNVIDYDVIRARINQLRERFNIIEIAADRWNATQIITQLVGDGFNVVPFGQGFASMTAPTKECEKLVVSGKLRHGGNPVLKWMASNVSVELDPAGNIKPSKRTSTDRIDGMVATIMALGRAMVGGDTELDVRVM
jgi:phage terminase large subunit-like protein